jgi:hypothetical protein
MSTAPASSSNEAVAERLSKFWTFSQNNSGGKFDYQPNDGITHYVIVEATNETHALARALDIGLYFNGCDSGMDCDCCGDRWSEPYGSGTDAPEVYGKPADKYVDMFGSRFEKGSVCVHYVDGRKEWL